MNKKLIILFLVLNVTGINFPIYAEPAPPKFYDVASRPPKPLPPETGKVKDILATNLIKLESGHVIRLLGVEPTRKIEVRRRAVEFMMSQVNGKTVKLSYDKKLNDELGRLLAYVTLETNPPQTGPIQEDLLYRGYAYTSKKYPCKEYARFRRYEKVAKREKRGIWEGI